MADIFIITSPQTPTLPLFKNGKGISVPIGKETSVPDDFLNVLDDTDGVTYRIVGCLGPDVEAPPPFDASSIIDGTVAEVSARLADLTPEQILSVREAEDGRDPPRKGILKAIEQQITALNEDTPQ